MGRALLVVGSPRRGGNSDTMAAIAARTLEQEGIAAETVYLRDLRFVPCQACGACAQNGLCVLTDDLTPVTAALLATEMVILAAPIYFQNLGALTKAFIDRSQPFWSVKYIQKKSLIGDPELRRRRRVYALLCGGTAFPDMFDCAVKSIRIFSLMLEADYRGGVFLPRVEAPGDIAGDPAKTEEIISGVRAFGRG
ncbi:MAG: flavodoxin family protein [bacterium]|jgi:putative NADPH-quinone reductase